MKLGSRWASARAQTCNHIQYEAELKDGGNHVYVQLFFIYRSSMKGSFETSQERISGFSIGSYVITINLARDRDRLSDC